MSNIRKPNRLKQLQDLLEQGEHLPATFDAADALGIEAAEEGDFAAADHDHDMAYAAADHNHDMAYAAGDHNHDTAYVVKNPVMHIADTDGGATIDVEARAKIVAILDVLENAGMMMPAD